MGKIENILGDSVQRQIDRDASRDFEPASSTVNQGPPKCRFCRKPILRRDKPEVYTWEVQNNAHVNCAKKHQDNS